MALRGLLETCRCPIFAEMLRVRPVALTLAAFGAAQIGGSMFLGLGVPCMFFHTTGIPCPGCGLTRSVMALLRGHVAESLLLHPLGAPLLAALVLALLAAVAPARVRDKLLRAITAVERKSGLMIVGVALLFLIWGVRLTGITPLSSLR